MPATGSSRLLVASSVACAGALACFGAVRATWVTGAGSTLVLPVNGSRPARLPIAGRVLSGGDAGAAPALAASVLVVVLILWGVLASDRFRRGLLVAATALAGVCFGVVAAAARTAAHRSADAGVRAPSVRPAPVVVAMAAALVTAIASGLALHASRTAAPVTLPESAPEMPAGDADG